MKSKSKKDIIDNQRPLCISPLAVVMMSEDEKLHNIWKSKNGHKGLSITNSPTDKHSQGLK